MIEAKIVADSVGPNGIRITTFVLTYPRFVHAEFMTHRKFSRNASSSRAIPVKKQIQMVIDNPAIPLAFTKNKPGMQGGDPLDQEAHDKALAAWLAARDSAVNFAQTLSDLEVHKQYANRILEPWAHITVVVTATDWDNFFSLRIHPAAQPEICALATKMYELFSTNTPQQLKKDMWHLPFVDEEAMEEVRQYYNVQCLQDDPNAVKLAIMRSVARCARVSYLNHDGTKTSIGDDLKLYDRLLGQIPIHASPAEHQAKALGSEWEFYSSGNFRGWIQYRKTLQHENIEKYVPFQS